MKILPLLSSSKGNSYIVNAGNITIIFECGLPASEVLKKVKYEPIVLLTHEHSDHSKYIEQYLKLGINVYTSYGTKQKLLERNRCLKLYNAYFHSFRLINGKYEMLDKVTFSILAFRTKHDAEEPIGFYLLNKLTKETLLFATDTYYIKERFDKVNYLMVECNYSREIAKKNLSNNTISKSLYSRLIESHFEFENVKTFIKSLNQDELKEIYLLHLSSKNSDENLFKEEIQKITGKPVIVCKERSG